MSETSGRAEDARIRQELADSTSRHESERAQALIDAFIVKARELGVEPVPLRAKTFSGADVKTDRTGWYIRRNRSIAIGVDGGYYQLTVPGGGLLDRFKGVSVKPTPPPLVVGRGGRDGETGDLAEFLERALSRTE